MSKDKMSKDKMSEKLLNLLNSFDPYWKPLRGLVPPQGLCW
jgi:hypothetical protein